jgi:hypothetical protein
MRGEKAILIAAVKAVRGSHAIWTASCHCREKPVPELSHIDPRSTALLVMDYQVDTLTRFMTAAQSADAIACVPDLITMARDAGLMVIHVAISDGTQGH